MPNASTISNTSSLPVPVKKGGRPVGARNKRTVFVEQLFQKNRKDIKQIVDTCVRLAKQGDVDHAKLVLDRICPVRKGALLHFEMLPIKTMADVQAAYSGLLMAVSQGRISSAEAVELSTVVDRLRQAIETTDLEDRIARLEQAADKGRDE